MSTAWGWGACCSVSWGRGGTTTIVFGSTRCPTGSPADMILITTILCVVGGVVLHGIGSSPAIERLARPSRGIASVVPGR
jgi:hypothetical protein